SPATARSRPSGRADPPRLSPCSDGGAYWAKNKAGKGKVPDLLPFQPLIHLRPPVGDGQILREEDLTGPTSASRIWVDDVNGDGKLDILVGDCVQLISPAQGVSDAEFKKRYADWQKEFRAAREALDSGDEKARAKAVEEYSKVFSRHA